MDGRAALSRFRRPISARSDRAAGSAQILAAGPRFGVPILNSSPGTLWTGGDGGNDRPRPPATPRPRPAEERLSHRELQMLTQLEKKVHVLLHQNTERNWLSVSCMTMCSLQTLRESLLSCRASDDLRQSLILTPALSLIASRQWRQC